MEEQVETSVSAGALMARVDDGPMNDLHEATDPFSSEPNAEQIARQTRAEDDLEQCWYCHFLNGALGKRDRDDPLYVGPLLEAHFQERLKMGERQSTESIAKIMHAEWTAKVYDPLRARGEPAIEPFRMSVAKFAHCIRNHTAPIHIAMHNNDDMIGRMHVKKLLFSNFYTEDENGGRVLNLPVMTLYGTLTGQDQRTAGQRVNVQIWNDRPGGVKRARR